MQKQVNQQNNRNQSVQFGRALLTGFIGGVFWSAVGMLMYYFNFIEIPVKSLVLTFWIKASWAQSWIGNVVSIFLIGLLSIVVAIIYYGLFKKRNSMWVGFWFGIVLWFIVFYFFNSFMDNVPSLSNLKNETIVSTLSLYSLYGLFVGYSISFDYNDNRVAVRQEE
ncbi:hypothetical protein KQI49_05930 [Virgibacillus sp. MSJ-26]|uniref:YqhR family membrane protein n=1 Tax=Virgibacillus sp. MSJ-26 TaxID=2841522 RepID=UPI001C0F900E|nr:YqhR family membrane protein [Virgibacillus sp. MSJ-26]MBU5466373.1 hypothetical protein [Virgibacillus sp. MSJ-26]